MGFPKLCGEIKFIFSPKLNINPRHNALPFIQKSEKCKEKRFHCVQYSSLQLHYALSYMLYHGASRTWSQVLTVRYENCPWICGDRIKANWFAFVTWSAGTDTVHQSGKHSPTRAGISVSSPREIVATPGPRYALTVPFSNFDY